MELLKRHVLLRFPDGREAVVFGKQGAYLSSSEAEQFRKYREIAFQTLTPGPEWGIDSAEFARFTQLARANGWLYRPLLGSEVLTSAQATESIEGFVAMWKPLLRTHPLMEKAQASAEVALPYLLEKVWFVSQASLYLREAAENSQGELRTILEDLERSERDHYKSLAMALGLSPSEMAQHEPETSTLLLVTYLHSLARRSPLGLLVSLSLFEASPEAEQGTVRAYEAMERVTGVDLSAFREHFLLDLAEDHKDLWKKAVLQREEVSAALLSDCIDALHATRHAVAAWYDGMNAAFPVKTAIPAPVPLRARFFWKPRPQAEVKGNL
ncbi:hypothetical protein K2X33_06655 [bacterium]|nr:hypothetical protein [bacterium]